MNHQYTDVGRQATDALDAQVKYFEGRGFSAAEALRAALHQLETVMQDEGGLQLVLREKPAELKDTSTAG